MQEYIKVTKEHDEGPQIDVKMETKGVIYVIGKLIETVSKKTGVSEEQIVEAVLYANKATQKE